MAFCQQCPHCPRSFTKPAKLAQHVLTHTGERPFACDSCAQTFRRADHLRRHVKLRHFKPATFEFECEHCRKGFHLRHHWQRHMSSGACRSDRAEEKAGEGKKHRCEQCDYVATTKALLRRHCRRKHQARLYVCDKCSAAFPLWSALLTHRRECVSTMTMPSSYYCEDCHMDVPNAGILRRHQHWHGGRWACAECGQRMSSAHALCVHRRAVHEGVRPYQCPHCSLTFAHKHLLQRHHRTCNIE